MSLGDRARRSAQRARAGRPAGLAGIAYRALSRGGAAGRHVVAAASAVTTRESAHVWDERPHDGHDDGELASLRAELDRELDRLTRPPQES
jgi:hypothetical protein